MTLIPNNTYSHSSNRMGLLKQTLTSSKCCSEFYVSDQCILFLFGDVYSGPVIYLMKYHHPPLKTKFLYPNNPSSQFLQKFWIPIFSISPKILDAPVLSTFHIRTKTNLECKLSNAIFLAILETKKGVNIFILIQKNIVWMFPSLRVNAIFHFLVKNMMLLSQVSVSSIRFLAFFMMIVGSTIHP